MLGKGTQYIWSEHTTVVSIKNPSVLPHVLSTSDLSSSSISGTTATGVTWALKSDALRKLGGSYTNI